MLKNILLLLILTLSPMIHAQQINGMQRGQRGFTPPARDSQASFVKLKDPAEETNRMIAKCEEALQIDDFQKEILKNIMMKKLEDDNAILSEKDITSDVRRKNLDSRNKVFYIELESILSLEQVEKFKNIDFTETREDRKKKKKRKRKEKS